MFLLSEWTHAEGVFSWVWAQVPSLVRKYVKGLVGGVKQLPCVCLSEYGNRFRQMQLHIFTFGPGCDFTLLTNCACFRITMPVSTMVKNNWSKPWPMFKNPVPRAWNKNCGCCLCKCFCWLWEWEKRLREFMQIRSCYVFSVIHTVILKGK